MIIFLIFETLFEIPLKKFCKDWSRLNLKLTKDFISYVEIDPRYIDYPNNHATRLTEAVEQTEKFLMIYDLNEQDTSRFN